jgi:cell division protein FtsL
MNSPKKNIREGLASLSTRERIILLCLLVLVVVFSADFLFNRLYLERNRELKASVARAEEQILHNQRLLSREELIHAQYKKLESPAAAVEDSVLTETQVLRELADLAANKVYVKSVVPRLGHHEGRQVMFVALDFEGPFEAVVEYMEKILNEMPSEVGSLSLAPGSGDGGGVLCRMSIRVECFES